MDRKLLKLTLTSGSSKVFNCLSITRDIRARDGDLSSAALFSVRALNYGVFFKEPTDKSWNAKVDAPVDTLLYFPYDADNLGEGGASVSLNDSRFGAVVREFTQSFGTLENRSNENDLAILDVIRASPSLDPYLLKSAFQRAGVAIPPGYLRISDDEWRTIREYVRRKLMPMIEFGLQGSGADTRRKVDGFVDRIWDGSDVSSLHPLLEALRIPLDDADDVIFAWKGLTFFEYQYERKAEELKGWAAWLKLHARPADLVRYELRSMIDGRRDEVRRTLRKHWQVVVGVLSEYHFGYNRLFVERAGAAEFKAFLGGCRRHYVALGAALNRIDHAMEIMNRMLKGDRQRSLKSDELEELFQCVVDVLR